MKSDAQLVQDALKGGPEGFGPVIDRWRHAVFGVALSRVGEFHEAEDAAQEAFLEAYRRLESLKDPRRLGAWLRSITIHVCIDRIRKRKDTQSLDEVGDAVSLNEVSKNESELREQILEAVGRLSRPQRETTTLFYIDGFSVDEVAAIQEVPLGTVKRRLHEARGKLKEEMVGMVESTLKANAPKDNFADRVFELLSSRRPVGGRPELSWHDIVTELKQIGTKGIDGFIKAFASPYWRTRQQAAWHAKTTSPPSAEKLEAIIEMLKSGVTDSNKKVRRAAGEALMQVEVDDERKRKEFLPLIVPLLNDRSKKVRSTICWTLRNWAKDIPVDTVTQSLLNEKEPRAKWAKSHLLRRILAAKEK